MSARGPHAAVTSAGNCTRLRTSVKSSRRHQLSSAVVVAAEGTHQRRESTCLEDLIELLHGRRLRPIETRQLLLHPVFQDSLRNQPVRPQRNIAVGPSMLTVTKIGVRHQQRQDAAGGRTLLADPQRIPKAVGLPVRVVKRNAALSKRRYHGMQHVGARRQEHHGLAVLQVLLGAA